MLTRLQELTKAFWSADNEWSRLGQKEFGKRWERARYNREGEGKPDSELNKAYCAFVAARISLDEYYTATQAERDARNQAAGAVTSYLTGTVSTFLP